MKLSDLISYVNTINGLTTSDISDIVDVKLRALLTDMHNNGMTPDLNSDFLSINVAAQDVLDDLQRLDDNLSILKDKINGHRTEEEVQALRASYNLYVNFQNRQNKAEYMFKSYVPHLREYFYDLETDNYLNGRITLYSSWHHPSAVVRPLLGENLESMLASDILYVLDEEVELLAPTKELFTKEYQDRIRYKIIDENRDLTMLRPLPDEQLGFIFLNEFFNFRPIEVIKQYLTGIMRVLKPGGVAMFTYNNCDLPGAVQNFEAGMYCYTPGTLMLPLIESFGFEIINKYDKSAINKSWFEIKKPGTLKSIKGGQTLAEIVKEIDQTT